MRRLPVCPEGSRRGSRHPSSQLNLSSARAGTRTVPADAPTAGGAGGWPRGTVQPTDNDRSDPRGQSLFPAPCRNPPAVRSGVGSMRFWRLAESAAAALRAGASSSRACPLHLDWTLTDYYRQRLTAHAVRALTGPRTHARVQHPASYDFLGSFIPSLSRYSFHPLSRSPG